MAKTEKAAQLKEHLLQFSGPMSEVEREFLDALNQFVESGLSKDWSFQLMLEDVGRNLEMLARTGKAKYSFPKASPPKSSMTTDERKFLVEMRAFVDFALRNGLSYSTVVDTIAHDVNGLRFHGGMKGAKSRSFKPKVTGFAVLDELSVGAPDEE